MHICEIICHLWSSVPTHVTLGQNFLHQIREKKKRKKKFIYATLKKKTVSDNIVHFTQIQNPLGVAQVSQTYTWADNPTTTQCLLKDLAVPSDNMLCVHCCTVRLVLSPHSFILITYVCPQSSVLSSQSLFHSYQSSVFRYLSSLLFSSIICTRLSSLIPKYFGFQFG